MDNTGLAAISIAAFSIIGELISCLASKGVISDTEVQTLLEKARIKNVEMARSATTSANEEAAGVIAELMASLKRV